MTPTSSENIIRIDNMFDNTESLLCNLYERWQSEKQYEDINDYQQVIEKKIPKVYYESSTSTTNKRSIRTT